jgi:lipopolysaccharide/colanic/teichoic acid biosynthesis glycosyltransferase
MYADADARFAELGGWSSDEKRDPRITFLGHILRKTNLDELPQLWDIFCGRMSVVGPRPEQPKYVEKFSHELPDYIKRHHVKSGLTGWAQVNGLRGDTSIAERVKYDLYYIQNWSILFDIRIIISTFLIVIKQIFGATQ